MRCIALGQAWQDRGERDEGGRRKAEEGRLKSDDGDWGSDVGCRMSDVRDVVENALSCTTKSEPRSVIFICAELPDALEKRLHKEGFDVVRIDVVPGSPQDAQKTLQIINKYNPHNSNSNVHPSDFISPPSPWLVLDGYRFKTDYHRAICSGHPRADVLKAEGRERKAEVRSETDSSERNVSDISFSNNEQRMNNKEQAIQLLVIDDYNHLPEYECDILLNQNLGAEKYVYNINPDAQLLLGPKYVLLRREFRNTAKKRGENPPRNTQKSRKNKRTQFREFRVFRGGKKTTHRHLSGRYMSRFSKVPIIGSSRKKSSNDWKNGRKKFQPLELFEKKVPTIGKNILVTMGGADTHNITAKLLETINHINSDNLYVKVVVGAANRWINDIVALIEQSPHKMELLTSVVNMPEQMLWADFAVTAAGSTCWELCCLGVPFAVVIVADNQREIASQLEAAGATISMGWHENMATDGINDCLMRLINDQEVLSKLTVNSSHLVMAEGAVLVVKEIFQESLRQYTAVAILTSQESWMFPYSQKLCAELQKTGWCAKVFDNHESIGAEYSIVFMLSYFRIVPKECLEKHRYNLVVHESDLPLGKGWAPLFWQILEGKNRIPVVLFEATEEMDAGAIYIKDYILLKGHELHDEIRKKQAEKTSKMCQKFLREYGTLEGLPQKGKETIYSKRAPKDSQINPKLSIESQFNLLRIVDNEQYPAFFELNGRFYELRISRRNKEF